MRVLEPELHQIAEQVYNEFRRMISSYGTINMKDNIFVLEYTKRLPNEDGYITTKRQHQLTKKRNRKERYDREHESNPRENIVIKLPVHENTSQKVYKSVETQTEPTESYLMNKLVNETLKVNNSIKMNLEKHLEIQRKLNKSKKEDMTLLDNLSEERKKKCHQILQENGFILSYSGVIKVLISERIKSHDIIESKSVNQKTLEKMIALSKLSNHEPYPDDYYYDGRETYDDEDYDSKSDSD
jgi:hypothetical protein